MLAAIDAMKAVAQAADSLLVADACDVSHVAVPGNS